MVKNQNFKNIFIYHEKEKQNSDMKKKKKQNASPFALASVPFARHIHIIGQHTVIAVPLHATSGHRIYLLL